MDVSIKTLWIRILDATQIYLFFQNEIVISKISAFSTNKSEKFPNIADNNFAFFVNYKGFL